MVTAVFGKKIDQSQQFLQDGTRIPVTHLHVPGSVVVAVKNPTKNGYWAIQIALGSNSKPTKSLQGVIRGANLQKAPRFLREIKLSVSGEVAEDQLPKAGDTVKASDVLKIGDIVDVIGVSKGKGFAGGVKRYGFKGGPRTHGQSDRERAPGSIGQTTTPGRVYKGKRMAGKMGHDTVTVRNLEIVGITDDTLLIKGLVPGSLNSFVMVRKTGKEMKNPVALYAEVIEEATPEPMQEAPVDQPQEESQETQPQPEEPQEKVEASQADVPPTESSDEKPAENVKKEATENAS